jgi:hypothetical protein
MTRIKQIGRFTATGRKFFGDKLRTVTFDVELDIATLEDMAIRASHNKSRKSVDGPIRVKVVDVKQS